MKPVLYVLVFFGMVFLAGCGGAAYRDGVYTGKSGEDDRGAWGEVTITIRDREVAACVFVTRQKDGSIKDENYGKINGEVSNPDYYQKAQLAVAAMESYAEAYAASGDLRKVDVISGATIAHNQFLEAAEGALSQARKK